MDKKELRQDPIREKILVALSYIENNRNALYGIVVGVMVIILVGSYLSTTQKEMDRKSSLSFGKAINNSIAGDKDTSVMLFQEKAAKELLELYIIPQSEYDILKNELTPIITRQ